MKKLLAIVMAIALVGICSAAYAERILPDEVLGELYAGLDLDINKVVVKDSAAVAQSNVGAIVSLGGNILNSDITNKNKAFVLNKKGNSAVAVQSNIGGAVAWAGWVDGAVIENKNKATVKNKKYDDDDQRDGVDAESIYLNSPEVNTLFDLNQVLANGSAVAAQSNIGAIVGNTGVANSSITNKNKACVVNSPK